GLIKLVLALQHEEIPPHLHFGTPSTHIPWDSLPVEVVTARRPWPASSGPRLAGVSSFGFSGTNVHVVLEGAPQEAPRRSEVERPLHLLALSARSAAALGDVASGYEGRLGEAKAVVSLGDVAFTAGAGRSHFKHRLAVVAATPDEAVAKLAA